MFLLLYLGAFMQPCCCLAVVSIVTLNAVASGAFAVSVVVLGAVDVSAYAVSDVAVEKVAVAARAKCVYRHVLLL